jgi:hypothetical protein
MRVLLGDLVHEVVVLEIELGARWRHARSGDEHENQQGR